MATKEAEEGEKIPDPTALFTSRAFSVPLKHIPMHRECSHWEHRLLKANHSSSSFPFLYVPVQILAQIN